MSFPSLAFEPGDILGVAHTPLLSVPLDVLQQDNLRCLRSQQTQLPPSQLQPRPRLHDLSV